jgi:thiamine phosphate synthase YjbQ (UPF0047 family)
MSTFSVDNLTDKVTRASVHADLRGVLNNRARTQRRFLHKRADDNTNYHLKEARKKSPVAVPVIRRSAPKHPALRLAAE